MTARILVFGFVQGVGFRQAVKRKARFLGLTGFVRNLPDNRVEALFAGEKDKIEEAIQFCKKGPFFSEVKHIEVEWKEEEKFNDFEIIK